MTEQCPNHGAFTIEQKRTARQRLADALALMASGAIPLGEGVQMELQHAEVYSGLKDLPMDFGLIAFREPSRISRHKLAYTVDWLLKREPDEIARRVDGDIYHKIQTVVDVSSPLASGFESVVVGQTCADVRMLLGEPSLTEDMAVPAGSAWGMQEALAYKIPAGALVRRWIYESSGTDYTVFFASVDDVWRVTLSLRLPSSLRKT